MARGLLSSACDSTREPVAPEARGGRAGARRPLKENSEIPIIDAQRRLVGWTSIAPDYRGALLHHAEAERLVGGPVLCTYVQIEGAHDATRAGAPPGWKGAWRCLGLCSERGLSPRLGPGLPAIELSARGS